MIEKPKTQRQKMVDRLSKFDESFDWGVFLKSDRSNYALLDEYPLLVDNYMACNVLKTLRLNMSDLRGKKLLDVGAGQAAFVRVVAKEGVDAIALDKNVHSNPESPMSPKNLHESGVPYVQGDAMHLPFSDNTFDFVTSNSGPVDNIEWVWEGEGAWRYASEKFSEKYPVVSEALRVLKPGGEIRFTQKVNDRPDIFHSNDAKEKFLHDLEAETYIEVTKILVQKDGEMGTYLSDEDADAERLTSYIGDTYIYVVKKVF